MERRIAVLVIVFLVAAADRPRARFADSFLSDGCPELTRTRRGSRPRDVRTRRMLRKGSGEVSCFYSRSTKLLLRRFKIRAGPRN